MSDGIVVAGMRILHEGAPAGDQARAFGYWPATPETVAPVLVRHETYGVEAEVADGVRTVIDAPSMFERFGVDRRGELAVRASAGDGPVEWLRTEVAGHRYVISRPAREEGTSMRWRWDRTVYAYALAARRAGIVAHAAAFEHGRGIVLCPGVSGTGKSTLATQLVAEGLAQRVLCDDRVALVRGERGIEAHGTPWHSTAGLARPLSGPLGAVVLVRKSGAGSIDRLAPADVLPFLLRAVALPFWDRAMLDGALETLDQALTGLPLLAYSYTPGPGALAPLLRALDRLDA